MIVKIEDVLAWESFQSRVNSQPLSSIVFTQCGEEYHTASQSVDDFKFTGLSNVHFILSGWYRGVAVDAAEVGNDS